MPTDTETPPAPAPRDCASAGPVAAAVSTWRRELAGVGGPNSLLWYDESQAALNVSQAHPGGITRLLSTGRTGLSDLYRERNSYAAALVRARVLRDKVDELREERGLTSLFLASGMVTFALGSRHVAAPLLLRPVALVPGEAPDEEYDLVIEGQDEVNPALRDLLARLGARIDTDEVLASVLNDVSVDPTAAQHELQRQAPHLGGLGVSPRLLITTFTYSKAVLAAELAENARTWSTRPLVRALAGVRQNDDDATTLPAADPDPDLTSEALALDLDPEQARAVQALRADRSVAVDAPATTGGTQLTAATVAALVGDGRTSLVVSPSRAALTAVLDRLHPLDLDDLVVHADDHPCAGDTAARQILSLVDADPAPPPEPDARHVAHLRDRLADHHDCLHARRSPWGVSLYEALTTVARLTDTVNTPTSRVRFPANALQRISLDDVRQAGRTLTDAAGRGAWNGGSDADPWFGARITSAEEARAAGLVLRRLLGVDGIDRARGLVHRMCAEAHLQPAETIDEWRTDIDAVAAVRATTEVFTLDVYDAPLTEMLAATSATYRETHGPHLGVWLRNARRRQAKALLRPGRAPADLHHELAAAHTQATLWHDRSGPAARPHQAPSLDVARRALDGVRADIAWLAPRLEGTAIGEDLETMPVTRLREHLADLARTLHRAGVVPAVSAQLDRVRSAGLGDLVDDFARRDLAPGRVATECEFVWWSSVLDALRADDPRYGEHDGAALRRVRDQYRDADAALLAGRAAQARHRATRAVRAAADDHPDQADALRNATHRSVADLWSIAPDILAAWPVWACGPGALPAVVPSGIRVDTTVLPAAHLMTPAVAAGAVARGRTVLAVGDLSGPAPSPYRTGAGLRTRDDDVALVRTGGSVLDVLAGQVPTLRLRVAYGRLDARLAEHVDGLAHLPCPGGPSPVVLERVGTSEELESPTPEVARVVRLVRAHLRTPRRRSLGVVTMTQQHADHILLGLRRELDAAALTALEALPEPFLVVPAHRLAGRRRDIVLLAPGYAVDGVGAAPHRFGVLQLGGGERLVTAAAGAARSTLVLVTSLTSTDLGAERDAEDDGIARLRRLLADVEDQTRSTRATTDRTDALVRHLGTRARTAGLEVRTAVGEEGHVIDLVVRRADGTGRPVAVLTDAAAGRSGTRERERLWPALLEARGYTPVHVCTADLFAAPEPEAARVIGAVERGR